MKKLLLLFSILLLIPASLASIYQSGDELTVSNNLSSNYYGAGGIITLSNAVQGDVLVAGGNISVNGPVMGDIAAAGGQVKISNHVFGDARIASGMAEITGPVDGDVVVFAGSTLISGNVSKDAVLDSGEISVGNVGGDLHANGQKITIKGIVKGNAVIKADEIVFSPGAKIKGNLNYTSSSRVNENFVEGTVTYVPEPQKKPADIFQSTLFAFGAALLLGIVLILLFSSRLGEASDLIFTSTWKVFFVGVAALILIPVFSVLLLISIIGIPVAIILILTYVAVLYFGKVILALAFGRRIFPGNIYFALLAGLVLYYLLRIIPFIDGITAVAGALFGLGVFVVLLWPKKKKISRRR